ncbi:uncharacterized protein LTR77_001956 [Saxophila tyrrhenica]|uniref:Uncharacterized protein n=1 Tax=Saxophila tyrrhenica TaxID=1690608 RepID=A0AAV9PKC5_9PEZI|nr:hypothetical protein LTR77_001956 [Saxophila tyrrhenica]
MEAEFTDLERKHAKATTIKPSKLKPAESKSKQPATIPRYFEGPGPTLAEEWRERTADLPFNLVYGCNLGHWRTMSSEEVQFWRAAWRQDHPGNTFSWNGEEEKARTLRGRLAEMMGWEDGGV